MLKKFQAELNKLLTPPERPLSDEQPADWHLQIAKATLFSLNKVWQGLRRLWQWRQHKR